MTDRTIEAPSLEEFVTGQEQRLRATVRFMVRRFGDAQRLDASDVYQEAMVRLCLAWSSADLRTEEAAHAYTGRIVKNVVLDLMRHAGRRHDNWLRTAHGHDQRSPETPADATVRRQMRRRLTDALHRLPRRQAIAFTLAAEDGLRRDEVAALMGESPEAVRGLLERARERLRRELSDFAAIGPMLATKLRRLHPSTWVTPSGIVGLTAWCLTVLYAPALPVDPLAPSLPAPAAPGWVAPIPAAAQIAVRPPGAPPVPLVPRVKPSTARHGTEAPSAAPASVCVAETCVGRNGDGDKLCVKPTDDTGHPVCARHAVAPTCEHVREDNPVVGCTRDGKPAWIVEPPPIP